MEIRGENWVTCTLVFLLDDDRVLLGRKMEKYVASRLNGPGGHVEDGESVPACACRETFAETGQGILIDEQDLDYRALVFCHNRKPDGSFFTVKIFVYTARKYIGQANDTSEMKDFAWYPLNGLPLGELAAGDRCWVERVLVGGERLVVVLPLDKEQHTLYDEPIVSLVKELPPDR